MNKDDGFDKRLGKGQLAEGFVFGYLTRHYQDTNFEVKNVKDYHPSGYRHNGLKLPDFAIFDGEKTILYLEVKSKKGWKNLLNISSKDVKHYVKVAKRENCPVELWFICTTDLCIYRMTEDVLRKPTTKASNNTIWLYEKEDCEKIFSKLPGDIFSKEIKFSW